MMPVASRANNVKYTRLAIAFVLVNALVWWLLFSVGRSSLDTYGDMAEAYSWGISWQWGYDKHPPLSAWTAAAWFQIFPTSDWAYYLLAMVNQGIAFWFVFLAGKRWLPLTEALLAVMLTSLIPLFGPDTGFRFNANSAMLPWLAIFAWSLIAALQTGSRRYLLIAGVAGGAACLVKYWAPLMLVSIASGAIIIAGESMTLSWRMALRKLLAISGVSALFFLPHLSWAVVHHWPGIRYARSAHSLSDSLSTVDATLEVFSDLFLVALLPIVVWLLSIYYVRLTSERPLPTTLGQAIQRPRSPRILMGASIFVAAVLLTLESAHLAGVSVATKWLIPAWLFFSWLLCSAIPVNLDARRLILPLGAMIGVYWIGLFVYAASINPSFDLSRDASNQRRTIANEITSEFHGLFGKPLNFVAGSEALSFSASFYSDDHPVAVPNLDFIRTSWVKEAKVRAAGLVVVCDGSQIDCVSTAVQRLGTPKRTSVWRGMADNGNSATVVELFYAPNAADAALGPNMATNRWGHP